LGEGGGRALAETLRLNTTLTSHNLGENDLGEGEGRALAEALRLNTTLASLDLGLNGLGEGEGRALAETLRLNTTLTSLDLSDNGIGQEVRSVLRQPGATGEAQRKKLSMADEQLHKHTHTHTRARRVDWWNAHIEHTLTHSMQCGVGECVGARLRTWGEINQVYFRSEHYCKRLHCSAAEVVDK
jgi:Ran GTPase-activating protein (RanGAP) involved in mRNA processing and transport